MHAHCWAFAVTVAAKAIQGYLTSISQSLPIVRLYMESLIRCSFSANDVQHLRNIHQIEKLRMRALSYQITVISMSVDIGQGGSALVSIVRKIPMSFSSRTFGDSGIV